MNNFDCAHCVVWEKECPMVKFIVEFLNSVVEYIVVAQMVGEFEANLIRNGIDYHCEVV